MPVSALYIASDLRVRQLGVAGGDFGDPKSHADFEPSRNCLFALELKVDGEWRPFLNVNKVSCPRFDTNSKDLSSFTVQFFAFERGIALAPSENAVEEIKK